MTPEQFCYWLQGYVELDGRMPESDQWMVIKDHLKHVFEKKTPVRPDLAEMLRREKPADFDPYIRPFSPDTKYNITC